MGWEVADRSFIWNRLCVFSGWCVALNACIVPWLLHVCVKQCYGVPLRQTCVNLSDRHVKTHMDVEHVLTFTMAPLHSPWDHRHKWCRSVSSCETFSTTWGQRTLKSRLVIRLVEPRSSKLEFNLFFSVTVFFSKCIHNSLLWFSVISNSFANRKCNVTELYISALQSQITEQTVSHVYIFLHK